MDKPAGLTSFDVIARVRRICRTRSVGHTGTLDPFATGLLVILLGRATRLARFVEAEAKTYLATARLGTATDTDDLTGTVIASAPAGWRPTREQVEAALEGFRGRSAQRPPPFSAKKVDGERSYLLARRGEMTELAPVEIEVHEIALVGLNGDEVQFRATVSAGTYLRAMARDLGERLGGAAHLTALRRETIGSLSVADAVPLEALTAETPMLEPLAVLGGMGTRQLTAAEVAAVGHGRAVSADGMEGRVALLHEGRLVAIAESRDRLLYPVVVLEPVA